MLRLPHLVAGIALVTITNAQGPVMSPLELRLEPEESDGGVPTAFAFLLVNRSDHEVRVPTPAVQCEDSFDGSIELRLDFRPLVPGAPGEGGGCAGDTMNWPPILERVKSWKVLKPRESLQVRGDHARLFYDADKPGIYEFWATYRPPSVNRADQETLRAVGVDFPDRRLSTQHVVFVKRP